MLVAHNNIVSEYDIIESKWTKHFIFPAKVKLIFRHTFIPDTHDYKIGILLENSTIHLLRADFELSNTNFKIKKVKGEERIIKIPGVITDYAFETQSD